MYGAAVLTIRNPLNALVAEWKRQKTIHTHAQPHAALLDKEYFGRLVYHNYGCEDVCQCVRRVFLATGINQSCGSDY